MAGRGREGEMEKGRERGREEGHTQTLRRKSRKGATMQYPATRRTSQHGPGPCSPVTARLGERAQAYLRWSSHSRRRSAAAAGFGSAPSSCRPPGGGGGGVGRRPDAPWAQGAWAPARTLPPLRLKTCIRVGGRKGKSERELEGEISSVRIGGWVRAGLSMRRRRRRAGQARRRRRLASLWNCGGGRLGSRLSRLWNRDVQGRVLSVYAGCERYGVVRVRRRHARVYISFCVCARACAHE